MHMMLYKFVDWPYRRRLFVTDRRRICSARPPPGVLLMHY